MDLRRVVSVTECAEVDNDLADALRTFRRTIGGRTGRGRSAHLAVGLGSSPMPRGSQRQVRGKEGPDEPSVAPTG